MHQLSQKVNSVPAHQQRDAERDAARKQLDPKQFIDELRDRSMPHIDWEARHYVELNNGERLEYNRKWFDNFAKLVVAECAVVMSKTRCGGVDACEFVKYLAKFNKHLGIKP